LKNLLLSRILPYKFPNSTIKREKLIDKMHENINKGLILIIAPAGYGKTILIQQYLGFSGMKYSWLNIHPDMNNFYVFMNYLIHSIKRINAEFGNSSLLLIEDYREKYEFSSNQDKITDDIIATFINELYLYFEDDLVLVLDEPGNLDNSEWVKLTFNKLFANIPSHIHFVITTRNLPVFSSASLLAKQNILKIEMNELAFTKKETGNLVKDIYNIDCGDKDIQLLTDALAGWITGLHLILQSHGEYFPRLQLDKLVIVDDIFNYFTEDIFADLSSEVKEFLMITSLLENFTSKQCNDLFKTEESAAIINELLRKNIFIQVLHTEPGGSEPRYSYQVLFKKFLNLKVKELKSESEINSFYRKVSDYYLEQNEIVPAVNYLLSAGQIQKAAELIHIHFQAYFDNGNFDILWKWLEKIEIGSSNSDYRLLYFKALLLKFFMGSTEESLPILDKAIELSLECKDNEFWIKCIISKTRNLISLGKITEALKILQTADRVKTKGTNKARILFLNAYILYQDSLYDKAIKYLNEAANILEHESDNSRNSTDLKLEIFNLFGHIFLIKGDYSKSISYYERVAVSTKKISLKYETLCNLVLLYSQSAKFDKAVTYLEEAKEISRLISIPIFRITYLLANQALRYEFGDFEGSIKLLEELNRTAIEIKHKYYIFLSYSLIGDSYYSLNKLNKAEEYFDMAFRYINENSEYEKVQFAYSKALLIKKTSTISEIETVLLKAYNYYEEQKMIYSRIQAAFHLADFYKKSGNTVKALQFIKEVLTVSEEKEYYAFLQREVFDHRELFDFACANKLKNKFIKDLLNSSLEKPEVSWISDESRIRYIETKDSLYDIHLKLLGKNEIRLRGSILDDSKWGKKKWKSIFIYLLVSAKMTLSKDRIIDLFYPETSAESADNIFHQMISKFRNLIRFTYTSDLLINVNDVTSTKTAKSGKNKNIDEIKLFPSLISYEDKQLQLSNDFTIYIDSVEFEKLSKKIPVIKDTAEKVKVMMNAVELYKGDFMEGNYETWCEELRTKYRTAFVTISEELIKLLYESADYHKTLHYSEILLKHEPVNLVCYEYIINSMMKLEKPQLAQLRYNQLVKFYKKEYDDVLPARLSEKFKKIIMN